MTLTDHVVENWFVGGVWEGVEVYWRSPSLTGSSVWGSEDQNADRHANSKGQICGKKFACALLLYRDLWEAEIK